MPLESFRGVQGTKPFPLYFFAIYTIFYSLIKRSATLLLRCASTVDSCFRPFELLTFHVITLFPDLLSTYTAVSVIGRGIKAERLAVKTYNPRDFCADKYKKVDDSPYGGGAGMVLKPEPFFRCIRIHMRGSFHKCWRRYKTATHAGFAHEPARTTVQTGNRAGALQ